MEQTKHLLAQEPDAARHLFNDSQQVYNLSTYLQHTGFPVYEQTNVTYFPLGEEQFAEMKTACEKQNASSSLNISSLHRGKCGMNFWKFSSNGHEQA